MMYNPVLGSVENSFGALWGVFWSFVPDMILAILVLIIGWLLGIIVGRIVTQILAALRVDNGLRAIGTEEMLDKAGIELNAPHFVGELVKWFIVATFLIGSLDFLGLNQVNVFLVKILAYLGNVFGAILIVLTAAVIADIAQKAVEHSSKMAGVRSAHFLGGLTKWAIWIFALIAALFQMNIGKDFLELLFGGIIVALAVAFGLAFGLGGKEAAARYLERLERDISPRGK